MEIKIVLGLLWGDEGKGNTVQWLCKKAISEGKKPCVVRFSGGPQAGHTVVNNGIRHVCSSFGSGVLLGVPTYYLDSAFIDPLCIMNEKEVLAQKGIENPVILFNQRCNVITPYDVMDQQIWAKDNPYLTCGKGIWSAKKRRLESRNFWPFVIMMSPGYPSEMLNAACSYYGERLRPNEKVLERWKKAAYEISNNICNDNILSDADVLIYESTQGLLLDEQNGFSPYVTSTHVGLDAIPIKHLHDAEVYLVSRTYLTRHGRMGQTEEHLFNANSISIPDKENETNVTNEYQGDFKTASWSPLPYIWAIHRNKLDNYQRIYNLEMNLVMTHVDAHTAWDTRMNCDFIVDSTTQLFNDNGVQISNVFTSDNQESNFKHLYSKK